jgi:Fe-S cluster assembly ATPase SufC
MGPNGAGKSTLGTTLLATPEYEVTEGVHLL